MHHFYNKTALFLLLITVLTACSSPNNQSQSESPSSKETTAPVKTINLSSPDTDAAEPAIASVADGSFFVLWVEHRPNQEADLMIRRFNASGQPEGDAVGINPKPSQVKTWYGDPPTIKIGRDNTIYVGWTAKFDGAKGSANVLYLSVSRNGGASFEQPVKVNDDTAPAAHGMHSLAVDESGRVYAAWLDERYLNSRRTEAQAAHDLSESYRFEKAAFFHHKEPEAEPNAELYFSISEDGGKTFSRNKKLAGDVCPCCKTSLLAASDGNLYISWRQVLPGDFRHIAIASSRDSGKTFSAPVTVSDDQWQINACPVSGAALSENQDKTLNVAWFTAGKAGKQGIYLSQSQDTGKTFSPRKLVSENAIGGTPLLVSDNTGKNQIVWAEAGKIMIASASDISDKQSLGKGEVPATAFSGNRFLIGFVEKENDRRTIKLAIAE